MDWSYIRISVLRSKVVSLILLCVLVTEIYYIVNIHLHRKNVVNISLPTTSDGDKQLPHELTLTRIERKIKHLWSLTTEGESDQERFDLSREHKNALLSDLRSFRRLDGRDGWRRREIQELSEIIQQRLTRLQNPGDCERARKVECRLAFCGFGCQVHQLGICLLISYVTNRTMVLERNMKRVYNDVTWNQVYLPWSNTCISNEGVTRVNWNKYHSIVSDPAQVLKIPVTHLIHPVPQYIEHMAVPEDLAPRMVRVLGRNPSAWWIGQIMKYVLRLQPSVQRMVDEAVRWLNISEVAPMVGIQVRRTDKLISEAKFHALEEYMGPVNDYYDRWEVYSSVQVKRRVFIATDDPSVLKEAVEKYRDYEILGNEHVVQTAGEIYRFSGKGLQGIIMDTNILANCDFVVCTFSSNVCRLVYEMKLAKDPLGTAEVHTLDDAYSLKGSTIHERFLFTFNSSGDVNEQLLKL